MAEFTVPREDRLLIAMKEEATAGVDVLGGTYVAGDIVPTIAGTVRYARQATHSENRMTAGQIGRGPAVQGARLATVSFSLFARGRGAAYSASVLPEFDRAMQGCMLSQTLVVTPGSESVTYKPSATAKTYTIYVVADIPGGLAWSAQLVGCVGTVRSSHRAGERLQFDFTFQGALDTEVDLTYVGGTLALTPPFPTHISAAFQIGAANYAPCIESINFDLGNQLVLIPCMNAAAGVQGYIVGTRVVSLRADPQLDREASSGWYAAIDGGILKDCSFQCGTVQYNKIKYQFSATLGATLQALNHGLISRNGILALDTEFLATLSAGNDEFAIILD
jgi:hypothetical protein